jgi:DNA-binding XRE family transcriptional regulator
MATRNPAASSLDEIPEVDLKKARILGRGLRKDRKLPLRALREATSKTQEEIASAAGMDQSEISRIEKRDDLRLSTLRRYAKAVDAEIEIVAVLPTGHRIKLDL